MIDDDDADDDADTLYGLGKKSTGAYGRAWWPRCTEVY